MRNVNPIYLPLLDYFLTEGLLNDLMQGKTLDLDEQYDYKPTEFTPVLFENDEFEFLDDCISDSDRIVPIQFGEYKPINFKKHANAKADINEIEISNYLVHLLAQVQRATPGIPDLTLEVVLAAIQVVCDDIYHRMRFYYFSDIESNRNDKYVDLIYNIEMSILASYKNTQRFHHQELFCATPALKRYYEEKHETIHSEEGSRVYDNQLDTHVKFIRGIHFENYKSYPLAINIFQPGFHSDFNAQCFERFANRRLKKLEACGVNVKDYDQRFANFEPYGLKFIFMYN